MHKTLPTLGNEKEQKQIEKQVLACLSSQLCHTPGNSPAFSGLISAPVGGNKIEISLAT